METLMNKKISTHWQFSGNVEGPAVGVFFRLHDAWEIFFFDEEEKAVTTLGRHELESKFKSDWNVVGQLKHQRCTLEIGGGLSSENLLVRS
jgi:hypothetical protein